MPWTPDDAERHTHKATTWELKELWAKIANECLERKGDEGRAIREANAVIARQAAGKSKLLVQQIVPGAHASQYSRFY
jgi:hypothetical protein